MSTPATYFNEREHRIYLVVRIGPGLRHAC